MCLTINDCQFKMSRYSHELICLNFMVTINQKYRLYSQKPKGKEIKHTTTESHQIAKGKIKRRNKQRRTTKQLENKD